MARWNAAANEEFGQVKRAFGASDAEMQALKQQIEIWADLNQNGSSRIPFGRYINSHVTVTTQGGWITSLAYGQM